MATAIRGRISLFGCLSTCLDRDLYKGVGACSEVGDATGVRIPFKRTAIMWFIQTLRSKADWLRFNYHRFPGS